MSFQEIELNKEQLQEIEADLHGLHVFDFVDGRDKTIVSNVSSFTGRRSAIVVDMTTTEFAIAYKAWQERLLLQDAFPTLNPDEREFIKTGITVKEWDASFASE